MGVGAALLAGMWTFADDASQTMLHWAPFAQGLPLIGWVARMLWVLLVVGLAIVNIKQLVMAICAPLMSLLAQRVRRPQRGRGRDRRRAVIAVARAARELVRGAALAVRNICLEAFFFLPIFMLGVIPVIGLTAPLVAICVQAYFVGFGNFDYSLETTHSIAASTQFVRRHRWLAIGNGSVFLLLWSSRLLLVALPLATIAATLVTHRRLIAAPHPARQYGVTSARPSDTPSAKVP